MHVGDNAPENTNTLLVAAEAEEAAKTQAAEFSELAERPVDPAQDNAPHSRREFLKRRVRDALTVGALTSGAEALMKTAEAVDFVNSAPEYRNRSVVTEPIDYGDMSQPAREGYPQGVLLLGDSLTWGYEHGHQVCIAEMVADDINRALAAAGVPDPGGPKSTDGFYWGNLMYAQPGITTAQVAKQVRRFSKMMANYPDYQGPWTTEASFGGNDALNYFSDHMNPFRIGSLISDFSGFLTQYERQSRSIIEELATLKQHPNLRGFGRIVIAGIPDIGKSTELWYMKIPFVRDIATAACKRMNFALAEVIEDVRETSGVEIYLDDMFDIPISEIHPTKKGYRKAADRRESRRIGLFPDGRHSFREEILAYHILPETPQLVPMARD